MCCSKSIVFPMAGAFQALPDKNQLLVNVHLFGDTGKIFCYWHKMGSAVPPRDTISNLLTPATTTNMNAWKGQWTG